MRRRRIRDMFRERAESSIAGAAIDHLEENPEASKADLLAVLTALFKDAPLWRWISPLLIPVIENVLEEWEGQPVGAAA